MNVKALEPIRYNGSRYAVGDVFTVQKQEGEQLLRSRSVEVVKEASVSAQKSIKKTSLSTPPAKNPQSEDGAGEKKNDEISARANKTELLKIAAEEEVPDVDETMTNEEIRLAITKHREEKQKQQTQG